MKIVTILGTRPQFIKAALVSKELKKRKITEVIVHTGQHYDHLMSNTFFRELHLPKPKHKLKLGNLSDNQMIGQMICQLEAILTYEEPDYVLVYGDCNTTLAGALSANKMKIKVIHIEAGVRSGDKTMPEEINRLLVDQLAQLKFAPTSNAAKHLLDEKLGSGVYTVGDPMMDLLRLQKPVIMEMMSKVLQRSQVEAGKYYVLTLHRAINTEDDAAFRRLLKKLDKLEYRVIFPVHPRTLKLIKKWSNSYKMEKIYYVSPLSYLEMMSLVMGCYKVLTDSGGLQKEAYELEKPCIILRENTEWTELVETGWNKLVPPSSRNLLEEIQQFEPPKDYHPDIFQTYAVHKIGEVLDELVKRPKFIHKRLNKPALSLRK